jgi:hypothetical protein
MRRGSRASFAGTWHRQGSRRGEREYNIVKTDTGSYKFVGYYAMATFYFGNISGLNRRKNGMIVARKTYPIICIGA